MPNDNGKNSVYRAVHSAIKKGVLIRPEICEKCGEKPNETSDGRSAIQAHHHDYSKPLEVEWLCASCHRLETPHPNSCGKPNFGEKNGYSKLKESQVSEIRNSKESSRKIAAIYGVDKSTITRIRNGAYWKAAPEGGNDEIPKG